MAIAAIGLNNPKLDVNVGGALRAAHVYGAKLIAIRGRRYHRQCSDTTKAYSHIPLLHTDNDIMDLCPHDCVPVAIEIIDGAIQLPRFQHPKNAFYIFGAEDQTLGDAVLGRCKYIVSVPTKFCMNLAATVNVILYDRMAKDNRYERTNRGHTGEGDIADRIPRHAGHVIQFGQPVSVGA